MSGHDETSWRQAIRRIHDDSTHHDWAALADAVNERYGLQGDASLCPSVPGLPPIWFQGDIEHVRPRQWVLVVSLNHQLANATEYANVSSENSWDTWCTHHRDHWYEGFFGPLTRLAAAATQVDLHGLSLAEYASDHVVFTELCPYASRTFSLGTQTVAELAASEPAFRTAASIRTILLNEARPTLVFINGWPAMQAFAAVYRDQFAWQPEKVYQSNDPPRDGRPPKRLWHQEGIYKAAAGEIPVVGFPFLRKPKTHNSYAEIDQLAEHIRTLRRVTGSPD